MEDTLNILGIVLIGMALLSVISVVVTESVYGGRRAKRLGVKGEIVKSEDCMVAVEMLIDYLNDSLSLEDRIINGTDTGCDGLAVLRNSRELADFVAKVHENGGRLVLRKKSDEDIECGENTRLEVEKILSDMDIARAKRIRNNYKK